MATSLKDSTATTHVAEFGETIKANPPVSRGHAAARPPFQPPPTCAVTCGGSSVLGSHRLRISEGTYAQADPHWLYHRPGHRRGGGMFGRQAARLRRLDESARIVVEVGSLIRGMSTTSKAVIPERSQFVEAHNRAILELQQFFLRINQLPMADVETLIADRSVRKWSRKFGYALTSKGASISNDNRVRILEAQGVEQTSTDKACVVHGDIAKQLGALDGPRQHTSGFTRLPTID